MIRRRRKSENVVATSSLPVFNCDSLISGDPGRRCPASSYAAEKTSSRQEDVSLGGAARRRSTGDRIEHLPIRGQFPGQPNRTARLLPYAAAVGISAMPHRCRTAAATGSPGGSPPFRIRVQQIIPHIGAGEIDIGTDPLQQPRAPEEFLTIRVVAVLNLAQGHHAIDAAKVMISSSPPKPASRINGSAAGQLSSRGREVAHCRSYRIGNYSSGEGTPDSMVAPVRAWGPLPQNSDLIIHQGAEALVVIFRARAFDLRRSEIELRLAQLHDRAESKFVAALRETERRVAPASATGRS